jgi:MSHA pilin protein MshA
MKKFLNKITFVELTLVFSIIGVVGVIAVPRYVDASQQALLQSKAAMTRTAKNVYQEMTREGGELPSVAMLAAHLPVQATRAQAAGISVRIDDADYTLPTYANSLCTVLTQSRDDKVACVGTIPS